MEEPNSLIRWTIFVFGGGDAATWGAFGIAAIAFLSLAPGRHRPVRPFVAGTIVAVCLAIIACASPPMPIWFQCVTGAWLAVTLIEVRRKPVPCRDTAARPAEGTLTTSRTVLWYVPFAWLLTALALELPFHFWFVPTKPISTLLVIGDSVTAGLTRISHWV